MGTEPADVRRRAHAHAVERVVAALDTHREQGLGEAAVLEHRRLYGENALSTHPERSRLARFFGQLNQPLIYLLIIAGAVSAVLRVWVDATVIFAVVFVNAVVGYLQEAKALDAIRALSEKLARQATVLREGRRRQIAVREVVVGDIVLLRAGDKVPADIRLCESAELRIDESVLTGESMPVEKTTATLEEGTLLNDRVNMAHASTLVTSGTASGVATAVGDATELGKIYDLVRKTERVETPLTKRLDWFGKVLLVAIVTLSVATFGIGVLRGQTAFDMFLAAVALAVGAVPEGMPAALTVILAIGVSRMARRRAVIRRLPAVETLGSTTVICSDKTGTLTLNQMTVVRAWAGGSVYDLETPGEATAPDTALRECLLGGVLCNDASVVHGEDRIDGDPTEVALIAAAQKLGVHGEKGTRLETLPFDSARKYMATLHVIDGQPRIYAKGSIESILGRSNSVLGPNGGTEDLNRGAVERLALDWASSGLRVLAIARKNLESGHEKLDAAELEQGLTLLGLEAMIDPPRPEAVQSVRACRNAGIAVKMITGDHAATALAIAKDVGIVDRDATGSVALSGHDIENMDDDALERIAEDARVFARVTPEHKLRLVSALQRSGNVVAMTGDGVNDAPALRMADIGVAMGRSGTEVAREAADLVLTDDNFASIRAAVEEGRAVLDNLLKFIAWTIPTNGGEALVVIVAIALGTALPILPVQILWINMTTAGVMGLLLAFEPKEGNLMDRPPREPSAPLLDSVLIARIVLVSILLCALSFVAFEWELALGAELSVARTAAVSVFVVGEFFYLFNCRSLTQSVFAVGFWSNPWIFAGGAVMLLLQLAFTYLPAMNTLFSSRPLPLDAWLRTVALGLSILVVVGTEKWARRRLGRSTCV